MYWKSRGRTGRSGAGFGAGVQTGPRRVDETWRDEVEGGLLVLLERCWTGEWNSLLRVVSTSAWRLEARAR